MIKILNPNDIIINEIEKDDFLMSLINNINDSLFKLEQFPINGFKTEIVTEDKISVRQKNLLMYIFGLNGWSFSINFLGETKEKENHYGIFIIEQKKVYLN